MNQYIQNTEDITFKLNPEYDYKTIKAFISKGCGRFYLESENFYSNNQKKYFNIISVETKVFLMHFLIISEVVWT